MKHTIKITAHFMQGPFGETKRTTFSFNKDLPLQSSGRNFGIFANHQASIHPRYKELVSQGWNAEKVTSRLWEGSA